MKLTEDSKEFYNTLKHIDPSIVTFIQPLHKNPLFDSIFQKIKLGYDKFENFSYVCTKTQISNIHDQIPANIKTHIHDSFDTVYICNILVNNFQFDISLIFDCKQTKRRLNSIIKNIYVALFVVSQFSNLPPSYHSIHIYFTHFKKLLPAKGVTLSEEHVNSAFVITCVQNRKINIFREEEWLKVLYHELIHLFGIESSCTSQENSDKLLHLKFNMKTNDHRIYECNTEIFALILHSSLIAFNKSSSQDITSMFSNLKKIIYNEVLFSSIQFIKILRHNDLSLQQIVNREHINYKENSHVLSYYVFKCACIIFINDYISMLNGSLHFHSNQYTHLINLIFENLQKLSKNEDFLKFCKNIKIKNTLLKKSLRMILNEVDI